MKSYLHFICPSDFIESVIKNAFDGEHYFITSLGNSMTFDQDVIIKVMGILELRNINTISFILSDDNHFVSDALGTEDFSGLNGLNDFYNQIKREKDYVKEYWQPGNRKFLISSYHLNNKIRELKRGLNEATLSQININGKIFQRHKKTFRNIFPDLILSGSLSLN